MKKVQDVIGLPVLDLSSGKKVGIVKDVFFNSSGEMVGMTVESHRLMTKIRYLSFENVGAVGDDAVTIGTERFLSSYIPNERFYGYHSGIRTYKELPVITTNGQELGHIKDVYFMEEMGKMIGYEISDGFLSDITEGRKMIKVPQRMILGEDALIVPIDEVKDIVFPEGETREE